MSPATTTNATLTSPNGSARLVAALIGAIVTYLSSRFDADLDLDPNERDPYTRAFLSAAVTFTELEADIKRENTRQGMAAAKALGKQTGRPPFGFDINAEGYLSPNDDFETALVILDHRARGDSKRSVANSAGISRRTVVLSMAGETSPMMNAARITLIPRIDTQWTIRLTSRARVVAPRFEEFTTYPQHPVSNDEWPPESQIELTLQSHQ